MQTPVSGLILAGGLSRRFGTDKAAHEIRGQTMIQVAYDALKAVTDDIIVSVRSPEQRYDLDVTYVTDRYRGMGPLAGLEAGFRVAKHDWLLVLACDMPLVSPNDVETLLEARASGVDAVVAIDEDGLTQPLCGCYSRAAAARHAKSLLQRRQLSMMGLLDRIEFRTVALSEMALVNVNRPADLEFYSLL